MKTIPSAILATLLAACFVHAEPIVTESSLPALLNDGSPTASTRCSSEQGQRFIDQGRYKDAIREFTGVIENDPTAVEGYRGRIEAQLLLGKYSDALGDYARVTA